MDDLEVTAYMVGQNQPYDVETPEIDLGQGPLTGTFSRPSNWPGSLEVSSQDLGWGYVDLEKQFIAVPKGTLEGPVVLSSVEYTVPMQDSSIENLSDPVMECVAWVNLSCPIGQGLLHTSAQMYAYSSSWYGVVPYFTYAEEVVPDIVNNPSSYSIKVDSLTAVLQYSSSSFHVYQYIDAEGDVLVDGLISRKASGTSYIACTLKGRAALTSGQVNVSNVITVQGPQGSSVKVSMSFTDPSVPGWSGADSVELSNISGTLFGSISPEYASLYTCK